MYTDDVKNSIKTIAFSFILRWWIELLTLFSSSHKQKIIVLICVSDHTILASFSFVIFHMWKNVIYHNILSDSVLCDIHGVSCRHSFIYSSLANKHRFFLYKVSHIFIQGIDSIVGSSQYANVKQLSLLLLSKIHHFIHIFLYSSTCVKSRRNGWNWQSLKFID